MSVENNILIVRRFFDELLNSDNPAVLNEFLAPGSFLLGFMSKFNQELLVGFSTHRLMVDDIFGTEDRVAACTSIHGVNSGPLLGHPATDKEVTLSGIWVLRLKDDRINSLQFQSDMAAQLWVPAPA